MDIGVLIADLIIQFGLAFIPANMAKKKGYSFGGFWCLSFFFFFLVSIVVAACLTDKNEFVRRDEIGAYGNPQDTNFELYCSHCGKGLFKEDQFCPKCGSKQMSQSI